MELDMDIKDGRGATAVADARQEPYRPLWQERTALLLGDEALGRLRSSTVVVAGLGGVGAYAAEMTARAGVGRMIIIDSDRVSESNKNRQLLALDSTVGQSKTDVMAARLLDINPDLWFFGCHFIGDPVMPGCLGLDAMWQLVGFYLGWLGGEGKGRALGVGEVKFTGQVLPTAKKVTYRIHFKRIVNRRLIMGLADGEVLVDGRLIYTASDLKVGLFQDTSAF